MIKKAIIFDFDGVIVDSEPARLNTYVQLFQQQFNREIRFDPKALIGKSEKENIRTLLLQNDIVISDQAFTELIRLRSSLLNEIALTELTLIKASEFILSNLNHRHIDLAIVSNSTQPYITRILQYFRLDRLFRTIISIEQVKNGKPHPDSYRLAMNHLNIQPNHCLAIEDSPTGIRAANAAGITCLGLTTSFDQSVLAEAKTCFAATNNDCAVWINSWMSDGD